VPRKIICVVVCVTGDDLSQYLRANKVLQSTSQDHDDYDLELLGKTSQELVREDVITHILASQFIDNHI
jgi:hypothetical protein